MRRDFHWDRKPGRPGFPLTMQHIAMALAALLLLSACSSFWETDLWDAEFWGFGREPETTTQAQFHTSATTIKMCCVEKACATVNDGAESCDPHETAKTCDENGEFCTNHGGPRFQGD